MDKTFGNTIEKRAKNYANEECHCYKCDGIDNFTHNDCKLSLEEGCQEHRWKEMGYKVGATEQKIIDINKACDWLDNYFMEIGYPDDWLRDSPNIKSGKERFRKAMEE